MYNELASMSEPAAGPELIVIELVHQIRETCGRKPVAYDLTYQWIVHAYLP